MPQILMSQLISFKVDQAITAQQAIVKHQVHEEMLLIECEFLLSGLEKESFAEFQQECSHLADYRAFKFCFAICVLRTITQRRG